MYNDASSDWHVVGGCEEKHKEVWDELIYFTFQTAEEDVVTVHVVSWSHCFKYQQFIYKNSFSDYIHFEMFNVEELFSTQRFWASPCWTLIHVILLKAKRKKIKKQRPKSAKNKSERKHCRLFTGRQKSSDIDALLWNV